MEKSSRANRRLVFVTRSRSSTFETTLKSPADYRQVCWYQIYNWLDDLHPGDEVCRHMVSDFLFFLEEKNMNLKRVTWEYEKGMEAMLAMVDMMEAAAKEVLPGVRCRHTAGWSWRGLYLDQVWFFAIRFDKPLRVDFENNMGLEPKQTSSLDLDKKHFFALTKDEQFEMLADFVRIASSEVPRTLNTTGTGKGLQEESADTVTSA